MSQRRGFKKMSTRFFKFALKKGYQKSYLPCNGVLYGTY